MVISIKKSTPPLKSLEPMFTTSCPRNSNVLTKFLALNLLFSIERLSGFIWLLSKREFPASIKNESLPGIMFFKKKVFLARPPSGFLGQPQS